MFYKEVLSAIAIALTFTAFIPYIRGIITGNIKPHMFSWVVWALTTVVVFFAQLKGQGGVGAWPIGVSGCISTTIAVLAYLKRTDITITRLDWVFFMVALSSLPFWHFTADPVWAVAILTLVDLLGFGPTISKAYSFPYSESVVFFGMFAARNSLVILALENYSVTTVLFPAAIAAACLFLILLVAIRRQQLAG
ncbi:MAG: hypothetical protein CTY34_01950 [Methylobacter sp.]|nr:MAG: hypothetical protein CTY34_01950 [Methylobacter sp.]PPD20534.1 MAG: hypothetical protein CTY24_09130 [Methylobacter sp.]PPD37203.1 MAG: hypothetical protein CTY18_02530 [Methylomonas sp.]